MKNEIKVIKKAIQKKELKYYIIGRLLRLIFLGLIYGLIIGFIAYVNYQYWFTFNCTW